MNKENFRVLKEINSLLIKCQKLNEDIASEYTRVSKIDRQIDLKKEELAELETKYALIREKLSLKEAELHTAEKQNDSATTNLNRAITEKEMKAAQDQLDSSQKSIDLLNEDILTSMEVEEEYLSKIEEIKTFLNGIIEGKTEIESDIETNTTPLKKELDSFKNRLDNLFQQIPAPHGESFKRLVDKNLPKGPITRLNQKNYCELCGTQISGLKEKAVEEKLEYTTCNGCGRVIIPESTQYL